MQEGDVVAIPTDGEQFGVIWILRIEPFGNGSKTYHCSSYVLLDRLPTIDEVPGLPMLTMHAPIDGASIEQNGKVLGNRRVLPADLAGFHEYLKRTNFKRFVEETGYDLSVQIPIAQRHYLRGNQLADEKRFREAIDAYSNALDVFPLFMEALDNRGLTYMDIGEFEKAVNDFSSSISQHGPNQIPLCSIGECFLKLGRFVEAEQVFQDCITRWPDVGQFKIYLLQARAGSSAAPSTPDRPKKPWWKLW